MVYLYRNQTGSWGSWRGECMEPDTQVLGKRKWSLPFDPMTGSLAEVRRLHVDVTSSCPKVGKGGEVFLSFVNLTLGEAVVIDVFHGEISASPRATFFISALDDMGMSPLDPLTRVATELGVPTWVLISLIKTHKPV